MKKLLFSIITFLWITIIILGCYNLYYFFVIHNFNFMEHFEWYKTHIHSISNTNVVLLLVFINIYFFKYYYKIKE